MAQAEAAAGAMPWRGPRAPARILVIRLQALGDVIATLPALRGLRARLPEAEIDFFTRRETADLPLHLDLFDRVHVLEGGRNASMQKLHALRLAPRLARRHYDIVIDLQNNLVSQAVRRRVRAPAWSEFDRYAPLAHGERARRAVVAALAGDVALDFRLSLKTSAGGLDLLPPAFRARELVVLNPAGAWPTRNWPLDRYVRFAELWRARHPNAGFAVLGDARIAAKARELGTALPGDLVDLAGATTVTQAFELLRAARLVLSEDSGLMHLAWCGGTPTLALFGSTRSDWARPLGDHSAFLDSTDLECGACMSPACRYGDVRCLTRYTPEFVAERAAALLAGVQAAAVHAALPADSRSYAPP